MSVLESTRACPAPKLSDRPADLDVAARPAIAVRFADFLELTKPRIAVLVLVTVTVGYALGSRGGLALVPLAHALAGIALVAGASSVFNQLYERRTDSRMPRTANRPLPAGRLAAAEVLSFGLVLGIGGTFYLALLVNAMTAALTALTLVLYAGVYTPLKRHTSLCTAVGAVPGALPPVLGWTAAGGDLSLEAFAVFAIMFLWQFPHFLAIAWLYREQYARAGLRMLPGIRPRPRTTAALAVVYALVLLPVSLLPAECGLAGDAYSWAAAILGLGYLLCAVSFLWNESTTSARRLLWSSLVYLPLLLTALTWNHFQLLQ